MFNIQTNNYEYYDMFMSLFLNIYFQENIFLKFIE